MKKTIKLLALALLLGACLAVPSKAEAQSFGYINSQELIALMPERDDALVELQKYGKELSETQSGMQTDLQNKYKEYMDKRANWSQAIIEAKEKELSDLNQRIEQFNQTAQEDFAQKQESLFRPIMTKANDAINKIAKAQKVAFVFDLAAGALAYWDEAQGVNLLPLVKAELGIPASKTQPTQLSQE